MQSFKRLFPKTTSIIGMIHVDPLPGTPQYESKALAVAKATSSDFIRNEGFIFSHIGDEGFIDSNAGELLRYRKMIDADNIMIFNDIKKKHSSHAITSDISLLDTANAAMFFNADGIILTGKSTGDSTDVNELKLIHKQQQEGKLKLPILVGSGVTKKNLHNYDLLTL
ncbi:CLUMA_CG021307, isoform A [Clunio marinus]|uniref:CLUMA_CG021307, isoform A n=1 Tax=Clunio marinus TaxID=568069 RepID=A0A1J1J8G3_9DIPT|nr:CLUMA_CG021307, isoform A [Clunio marinus]